MIKILIADDHPIVRRGLREIINEAPDMTVVDEATDGREVINKVRTNTYNVVVLDIDMPGIGGIEALTQLKHERPDLPVLMLSIHPERQFAVRALKIGASGYLVKESATDELVSAIRKVAGGNKYITSSLAEDLAANLYDAKQLPHRRLSDREFQIMRLIAMGRTVTEIAQELSLSVKTVNTHRMRILNKLNLKSNVQLAHYAIKNRIIT